MDRFGYFVEIMAGEVDGVWISPGEVGRLFGVVALWGARRGVKG